MRKVMTISRDFARKSICPIMIGLLFVSHAVRAQKPEIKPAEVKIRIENGTAQLLRNGKLYVVKGAGGNASMQILRDCGGNSVRTWGADNLEPVLDEAEKHGLTVAVGIWLGHKEHGFDYNNADQVAEQYESVRQTILKYRN